MMDAINKSDIGKIEGPLTVEACEKFVAEWSELSHVHSGYKGLFRTHVGAVDGLLVKTKAPSMNEIKKVSNFTRKRLG